MRDIILHDAERSKEQLMSRAKAKRMDSLEKAIEAALADGNFISYKAAWEFVEGLQRLADRVGELIASERTARRAFSRRLFRPAMRRRTRWTTGTGQAPMAILRGLRPSARLSEE